MKKINLQYALGEVFFIFLGITLAIGFQNWNEHRKQAKLEKEVLNQLKVALNNDLGDVNANINTHVRAMNACQSVLQTLDASEPVDDEAMLESLIMAIDYTFLVSDVSTYEYLKSVGLHIVQNDSLRRQITKLYDVVYEGIYGIENNAEPIQQALLVDIKRYFTGSPDFLVPTTDINAAKSDNELKFDLKNLEFSHQIMVRKYQQKVKPELEKLILMVDQEL